MLAQSNEIEERATCLLPNNDDGMKVIEKIKTQSIVVGRLKIEPEFCDVMVTFRWDFVFTFLLEGNEI
jgi:hypothetical protein